MTAGPSLPAGAVPTVEILVNGEARTVPATTTLLGLLGLLGVEERGVAIALDGEVVPRSTWDDAALPPGARVEIVTAASGG